MKAVLFSHIQTRRLEYCVQFGGPQHKKDAELLEWVQRRAMRGWSTSLVKESEGVGLV